jgi:hypothetical protein
MRQIGPLLLIAIGIAGSSTLHAQSSGCSNGNFNGVFALSLSGIVVPGLPISGDFGRLGRVAADGQGNTTATTQANYNGLIIEEDFPGTYKVADNCSVTWNVTIPTGPLNVTISGVILDGGKRVTLFVSNPGGAAIFGNLERQQTGCTPASLSGGYALRMTGHIEAGPPLTGPFSRNGQVVFDGAGNATVNNSVTSYSGAVLREIFPGTYTIDSTCTFTWQAVEPYPVLVPVTIQGILSEDGSHAYLMQTSPGGTVVTGEITLQ